MDINKLLADMGINESNLMITYKPDAGESITDSVINMMKIFLETEIVVVGNHNGKPLKVDSNLLGKWVDDVEGNGKAYEEGRGK